MATKPFSFEGRYARTASPPMPAPRPRAKFDFAVAYPDPDSLPLKELAQAAAAALEREGRGLALYPGARGYEPLRKLVAEKLARDRGMRVDPAQVLLTAGSMQSINLITEILVEPGDTVLTERFCYLGTLRTFRKFKAKVVGVNADEDGMRPEALRSTLRDLASRGVKPKLIYTISTFQNPEGSVLTLERRKELLLLAREYDVAVFEDECYSDLRFEGEWVPAIHSLDTDGRVLYASSFSKIIAPGVRIGYAVAPEEVVQRMLAAKIDGGTNELAAMMVQEYLRGHMKEHVDQINHILKAKRDTMLAALGEYMGPSVQWTRPQGGLFLWLTLPEGTDTVALAEKARAQDVGYIPGVQFSPDPERMGRNCLRLCFGHPTHDQIREGVARLARVFQQAGALG